jgi:hypothetical protein
MANTTFTGPVVSLNGIIGGPNPNAGGFGANDTEQGGKVPYTATNATTLTITSGSESGTKLLATASAGTLVYVSDGASGSAVYAFSNGTEWLRCDNLSFVSPTP